MNPIQIKINVAGSWANLVRCAPVRLGEVKAACEALATAHLGPVSFKALDGDTVIEQFSSQPRQGEPHGWYSPKQP